MSAPGSVGDAVRVGGVLLAAGAGRRFGMPKALVSLEGTTLVERGLRMLGGGGCDPVVVVLGAGADDVRARSDLSDVVVVDVGEGRPMADSLRAGLGALDGRADAAVLALVDQPLVRSAAVRRVIAAWRDGAPIAAASYGGRRGHPVVLDASVWAEAVDGASGDAGARRLLSDTTRVRMVDCTGSGAPDDIDTPEDLAAIRAALATTGA